MSDPTASPYTSTAGYPDQVVNPTPFDVTYTSVPTGVTATWSLVAGALFYDVYLGRSPQNLLLQRHKLVAPTYTFTNMTAGIPYYAQVVAYFAPRDSIGSVVQQIFSCYIYPPVFSLASGTYTGCQNLTITTASAGASIYYTTNGTAPTTASTLYTGTLSVCDSTPFRAIAARGVCVSTEVDASYTIIPVTACDYCARVLARVGLTGFWPLDDTQNLVGGVQNFVNLKAPTQPITWTDNGFNIYHEPALLGSCGNSIYYPTGSTLAPTIQSVKTPQASLSSTFTGTTNPWTIEFVFTGTRRVVSDALYQTPFYILDVPGAAVNQVNFTLQSNGFFVATVSGLASLTVLDGTYQQFPSGTQETYLVSLVYDGTNLTIYFNGQNHDAVQNGRPWSGFSGVPAWPTDNTVVFPTEGLYNGFHLTPFQSGVVNKNGFQNVSFYSTALSQAEILAGYNALVSGVGTTCH